MKEVGSTEFMTPSAFIFLYENQLFLTFRNQTVSVWNFRGELVTSFEDHVLSHPDCNTNNIYITSDQDLIVSFCKAADNQQFTDRRGEFTFMPFLLVESEASKCGIKQSESCFLLDWLQLVRLI